MEEDIDRVEFYQKLKDCKSNQNIETLIENIDNEELYTVILDKYNQILEFNKNEDVKNIIKILEFTYLNFGKKK